MATYFNIISAQFIGSTIQGIFENTDNTEIIFSDGNGDLWELIIDTNYRFYKL